MSHEEEEVISLSDEAAGAAVRIQVCDICTLHSNAKNVIVNPSGSISCIQHFIFAIYQPSVMYMSYLGVSIATSWISCVSHFSFLLLFLLFCKTDAISRLPGPQRGRTAKISTSKSWSRQISQTVRMNRSLLFVPTTHIPPIKAHTLLFVSRLLHPYRHEVHKTLEVILSKVIFFKPDDPREFVINELKKIQQKKSVSLLGLCLS